MKKKKKLSERKKRKMLYQKLQKQLNHAKKTGAVSDRTIEIYGSSIHTKRETEAVKEKIDELLTKRRG